MSVSPPRPSRRGPRWLASLVLASLIVTALGVASPSVAAELVIRVVGLRSALGEVHFALYDKPEGFPTYDGRIARGKVPVRQAGTVIRLPGLKPGRYAVAVFHDENGNDAFDQGFLGIPLEDYGFSNNASGFFGPPSFESAVVVVGETTTEIVIDIQR